MRLHFLFTILLLSSNIFSQFQNDSVIALFCGVNKGGLTYEEIIEKNKIELAFKNSCKPYAIKSFSISNSSPGVDWFVNVEDLAVLPMDVLERLSYYKDKIGNEFYIGNIIVEIDDKVIELSSHIEFQITGNYSGMFRRYNRSDSLEQDPYLHKGEFISKKGVVTKKQFLLMNKLEVSKFNNCKLVDPLYEVCSFEIEYVTSMDEDEAEHRKYSISSNIIPDSIKQEILSLHNGFHLKIINVYAIKGGNIITKVGDLSLIIYE